MPPEDQVVPGAGAEPAGAVSETHTTEPAGMTAASPPLGGAYAAATAPTTAPESAQPEPVRSAPPVITRDDVDALIRERLASALPEIGQQYEQQLARFAQSASDKRFANLMRELAPEMRGIDSAVKRGLMDADAARQAKTELLFERAAEIDRDAAPARPPAAPTGQFRPETVDWNERGLALIREAGLQPSDIPDLAKRNVAFDELAVLVARAKAAKEKEHDKAAWMKEYERQKGAVLGAERNGGVAPPPESGAAADSNTANPYDFNSREAYRRGAKSSSQ